MTQYEGMFILDPDLGADALKQAAHAVSETITKAGGTIGSAQEWGRRKLAYPVGKKREGHYLVVQFSIAPDAVARITAQFSLSEPILKSLVTKKTATSKPAEAQPA